MGIKSDDDLQLAVGCHNISTRLDPIDLEPIANMPAWRRKTSFCLFLTPIHGWEPLIAHRGEVLAPNYLHDSCLWVWTTQLGLLPNIL